MDAPSAASAHDSGGGAPEGASETTALSGSQPALGSSSTSSTSCGGGGVAGESTSTSGSTSTSDTEPTAPTDARPDAGSDAKSKASNDGPPPSEGGWEGIAWASGTLMLTAVVGVAAKFAGVIVTPGMRGVALQQTMDTTEIVTSTLGYTFTALLVALICGGSFELARIRGIGIVPRSIVVAVSGLVVALASPSVVQRLHPFAAFACAVVTSVIAFVAGIVALRAAHTRAVGAVLTLLAFCGLARPVAWMIVGTAGERANMTMYQGGRVLGTAAVVVQALATLLAAAWLATRSPWRGRLLSNLAVVLGFGVTYLAARETDGPPSAAVAVLRGSLREAASTTLAFGGSSIAAFLVPASLLLAVVALVQKRSSAAVNVALALALLSCGAFDVPIQALAVTAAAQWALLAMADPRSMWKPLLTAKSSA